MPIMSLKKEQQTQQAQRSYVLNLYQTQVKEQLYPVVLDAVKHNAYTQ